LVNIHLAVANTNFDLTLLPDTYAVQKVHYIPFINSFFAYFIIYFTITFLDLKKDKYSYYLLLSLLGLTWSCFVLQIFGVDIIIMGTLSGIMGLLTTLSLFFVGIRCFLKKVKQTKFFFFGNIFFNVSIFYALISSSIGNFGIITNNSIAIGSVLEMIFFALALGNRINILKEQNLQQQSQLIVQLKENEMLMEDLNKELEGTVSQKTELLSQINQELQQNIEELNTTMYQLEEQTKNTEQKNKQIQDSIRYAKQIQDTILPSDKKMRTLLGNYLLFYRAKDMVSGDFYWIGKLEEKTVVVTADSTGHGVPAAFLSLIAIQILKTIVLIQKITDPSQILFSMNESIRKSLRQHDKRNDDGIDMAVCTILPSEKLVEYAGAKSPLFYFQNEHSELLKGTPKSLGGISKNTEVHFIKYRVYCQSSTTFYLFSDGYRDQLSPQNERLGSVQFLKLLNEIHKKDFEEQLNDLQTNFEKWKKETTQNDDILILAFRL